MESLEDIRDILKCVLRCLKGKDDIMKESDNNLSVMNRDVGIMIGILQFADHVSLDEMHDIWMFVLKETSERGKTEEEDVINKDGLDVTVKEFEKGNKR